jgi:hypothetical protein
LSSDSRRLATGDNSGKVIIWHVDQEQPASACGITISDDAATCCSFFPGKDHRLMWVQGTAMPGGFIETVHVLWDYLAVKTDDTGVKYMYKPGALLPQHPPPAPEDFEYRYIRAACPVTGSPQQGGELVWCAYESGIIALHDMQTGDSWVLGQAGQLAVGAGLWKCCLAGQPSSLRWQQLQQGQHLMAVQPMLNHARLATVVQVLNCNDGTLVGCEWRGDGLFATNFCICGETG